MQRHQVYRMAGVVVAGMAILEAAIARHRIASPPAVDVLNLSHAENPKVVIQQVLVPHKPPFVQNVGKSAQIDLVKCSKEAAMTIALGRWYLTRPLLQ